MNHDLKFNQFYENYYGNLLVKNKFSNNLHEYYDALVKTAFASHRYALDSIRYESNEEEEEQQEANIEFELTNNFVEFYKESLKYKQEKKNQEKLKLKSIAEGKFVDYVEGEQVKTHVKVQSCFAPKESLSCKRELELKELYGDESYKRIQVLETQLQMNFDRNIDMHQPTYWPSLPLRL